MYPPDGKGGGSTDGQPLYNEHCSASDLPEKKQKQELLMTDPWDGFSICT